MSEAQSIFDQEIDFAQFQVRSSQTSKNWQSLVVGVLSLLSLVSIATTFGIVYILFLESSKFFATHEVELLGEKTQVDVGLWQFLVGQSWNLDAISGDTVEYGIRGLLIGTGKITLVAMAVALPLGLITAVYLSEYASQWARNIIKPILEVLAGIPTVVLGFFAYKFVTPWVLNGLPQWLSGTLPGVFGSEWIENPPFTSTNSASAGIAVGILCIPLVTSLAEDALQAVPRNLREGAYGLGSTRLEVTWKVVVPAALSGIISAFLLALSRAVGETMVVALAAGTSVNSSLDLRRPAQTMTGAIVHTIQSENISPGDLSYYSMYVVAATLFLITFGITLIGQLIRLRYREAYQ